MSTHGPSRGYQQHQPELMRQAKRVEKTLSTAACFHRVSHNYYDSC